MSHHLVEGRRSGGSPFDRGGCKEILGLDNWAALQYNVSKVKNAARCTSQRSRNTKEAKIVGSHYLPAVKIEAGVFCVVY